MSALLAWAQFLETQIFNKPTGVRRAGNMVCFLKRCGLFILLLVVGFSTRVWGEEEAVKAMAFDSPRQAMETLVRAVKSNDAEALIDIFGADSQDLVHSGDPVADRLDREKFLAAFYAHHSIQEQGPEKGIIILGEKAWPFPVPLVRQGEKWYFDASAGKEEILARRIGRNELNVIGVMNAYVDAQHAYAAKDPDGDGVHAFAPGLKSDKGKRNGLHWPVEEGEALSPLGPLVAQAVSQGDKAGGRKAVPYHGYCFKTLCGQGKHAHGGAFDYQKDGNWVLGHALLAYPANYGASGIMTFMVNQQGVIYEKDLGPDTPTLAAGITTFDPDESWQVLRNAGRP